jgi:hypothetical protein
MVVTHIAPDLSRPPLKRKSRKAAIKPPVITGDAPTAHGPSGAEWRALILKASAEHGPQTSSDLASLCGTTVHGRSYGRQRRLLQEQGQDRGRSERSRAALLAGGRRMSDAAHRAALDALRKAGREDHALALIR